MKKDKVIRFAQEDGTMNDVQVVDMLSGTTPDARRRLLKWYASMTDEQRLVVKAHQTRLMRVRDRLRQHHGMDIHVWAYAMSFLSLRQLQYARESMGRKRRVDEDSLVLLDRYRRSGWRKKRRGRQATTQEFVRANYPVLKQWREAGASWWDMPDLIKEHFGGRLLSRAALNKAYRQVEKDMAGWEEVDSTKIQDW
jgi:hypothetical protein